MNRWRRHNGAAAVVGLVIVACGIAFRVLAHDVEDEMLSYVIVVLSLTLTVFFARNAAEYRREEAHGLKQKRDLWESLVHELTEIREHAEHYTRLEDPQREPEGHIPTAVLEFVVRSDPAELADDEHAVVKSASSILKVASDLNWRIHATVADRHLSQDDSAAVAGSWKGVTDRCRDELLPMIDELAIQVNASLAALSDVAAKGKA